MSLETASSTQKPYPGAPGGQSGSQNSKDDLFWRILDAAVRLDMAKGHLRWKMTDLSRESSVTRSLIYYYFGHSKDAILQAAISITGEEFFGLSESRQALWNSGKLWESIQKTRQLVKALPHIPLFYLTQRQPGKPFYRAMLDLEKRYYQKLAFHFPHASPESLQAMYATFFGLCTVADLSDETLQHFVNGLMKTLTQSRQPVSV